MKKVIKISLLVLSGFFVLYTFYFLWEQAQPASETYELVQPRQRNIVKKITATGALESRTQVEVKPQVTGIVTKLYVQAGEFVKKGDIIAIINIIPDMGQLTQAQSQVESARISLVEVEREVSRSERLYDKGVISREEYEKEQTRLVAAKENVDAALSMVEVITKGSSKRVGSINTTEVRSSLSGMVLSVPVKVGVSVSGSSLFSQGTTIATIADMNDVIFRGNIDETEVAKLHKGMEITIIPGAMRNVEIPAVLDYISPEGVLLNGTKMFELKATAHIPENIEIRSGYSVNAHIILDEANNVMSIDEACVKYENGKPTLYRLISDEADVKNQRWELTPVVLGISDGIYVEIKSGITLNDKIRGIKK